MPTPYNPNRCEPDIIRQLVAAIFSSLTVESTLLEATVPETVSAVFTAVHHLINTCRETPGVNIEALRGSVHALYEALPPPPTKASTKVH